MPAIAKSYKLGPATMGNMASIAFIGMFLGAMVGGYLADSIGRKPVIVTSVLIWGIAGVILSLSSSVDAIRVCRFLIGLGLGTQLPTVAVMLSEMVPSRVRGKYLVFYIALLPVGMFLVGMLTYLLMPKLGWKGVALIEGLTALWAFVIWKFVPESALWLESKGKPEEADKIMGRIEAGIQLSTGQPLPPVDVKSVTISEQSATKEGSSPLVLFTKPFIGLVVLMTVYMLCQMMGFYGINMWLSSLLVLKGFSVTKSIVYVSLISLGGVPAFFLLGYLVDKAGRKWSVVIMAVLTAATAYFYGQAASFATVIVTGLLFMFCQFGYNMASMVFTTELWPTSVRGMGKGYSQACGRVGSSLGPIVIGYILAAGYGNSAVMLFAVGVNLLAAIVVWLFAPETKGKVF
jgi:putative MFS transporter